MNPGGTYPHYNSIPLLAFIVGLALTALLPFSAQAQSSRPSGNGLPLLQHWIGYNEGNSERPRLCAIRERTAYVDAPSGVRLIDLSDIDHPRFSSTLDLKHGVPVSLTIANDTLLLVSFSDAAALTVLDISDPAAPVVLFDTTISGFSSAEIRRGRLFVVTGVYGPNESHVYVDMYDIGDWRNLRSRWRLESIPARGFGGMWIVGDLLLIGQTYTDNEAFEVLQLSDTGQPRFVRTMSSLPTGYVVDVRLVADSLALFVLNGSGPVDVAALPLASILDENNHTPPWTLDADRNSLLTVATFDSSVVLRGLNFSDLLVSARLGPDGSLVLLDTLMPLPEHGKEGIPKKSVAIDDSLIIFLTYDGIRTATLDRDGRFHLRGLLKIHDGCFGVDGYGTIAYAVTVDSLHILDFSNRSDPDTLGSLAIGTGRVKVLGAQRLLLYDSVLTLVDVSNLRAPKIISRLGLGRNNFARSVAVRDSLLAVASPTGGTLIVRWRNDSLQRVGFIPLKGSDLLWRGDTLLITGHDFSLSIWNAADPSKPKLLRELQPDTLLGYALSASGDTLLLSGYRSTFYDISDLLDPRPIGDLRGALRHQLVGSQLYMAEITLNFSVYRIEASLELVSLGSIGFDRDPSFYATDSLIFLASGYEGLKVVSVDRALSVPDVPRNVLQLRCSPNPVSPSLAISFALPRAMNVSLALFDARGREVTKIADGSMEAGAHIETWNATELPAGIYFLRLQAGRFQQSEPIVLTR